MKKKVLVTGANGQLGKTIKELYKKNNIDLEFFFKSRKELDITEEEKIAVFFSKNSFDYCINCAAYTNVEQAEKTPEIAFKINSEAVKVLSQECAKNNIVLIHISTDYVFNGEKEEPYTINDEASPINEYGKSKLKGENHIKSILTKYFIIRTSWLYSKKYGNNFYRTILMKAKTEKQLSITTEQRGCPTNTENLAKYIIKLILNNSLNYGIKHFRDELIMTWYDFANKILLENNLLGGKKLVKVNKYITFAQRPRNCILKLNKMEYKKPKVIAEIGCNHKGDFNIAIDLLNKAKECGSDVAKFQKRNNKELLTKEQYNAAHPNQSNSYGDTYGAHREFLEFDVDQHKKLKEHCDSIGLEYSTSVWDVTSAKEMITFNPGLLKVPSACNSHFDMLKVLRDDYNGEVHLSFGMTNHKEEKKIIEFFEEKNQAKTRLIIYSCTSGYPVPFKDVCLLEIARLKDEYGDRVKEVGFSGHHLGIAIDNAAVALGATWIERHFTIDRTWKGTDHAASLEPSGLKKLCRDLAATYDALNFKASEILDIEKVQRDKLKYRK